MSVYNESTSAGAKEQRDHLNTLFDRGRQMAAETFATLERMQPKDYVVKAPSIDFAPFPTNQKHGELITNGGIHVGFNDMDFLMHKHAITQLCGHAKVGVGRDKTAWSTKVTRALLSEGSWGLQMLSRFFNEIIHRQGDSRYLLRTVMPDPDHSDEIRGWLTTRYRAVDSGPLIEALAHGVREFHALPIEARYCDTKVYIKFILPVIFEPVPGELMAVGLVFSNSDFGNGAEEARFFIVRLVCSNGMWGDDVYRRVHLGKKLPEGLEFSRETVELNTQLSASMMKDVVRNALAPEYVNAKIAAIKDAAEKEIDPRKQLQAMRDASKLSKEEVAKVTEIFNKPDVVELPQGNTAWRLANALSLFAKEVEPERGLELEALAGVTTNIVDPKKAN